jgi:hypothetical protein
MHGVDEGRLWSAKARANVLGAARSDSIGGLAKPRAVGDEHQIGVERLTRGNRVAGRWASRASRIWAKANGTNEETDRSSWCMPRRIGDGTRRMVGDPKQGRSRARKATRTSRRDEAWGGLETDGSGRSSGDAEGQHNPGGAKDPWGSGVLCRSEDRPDMPLANRNKRSCSRASTKGASNPATGKGGSEERSVPLPWSRTGENPPYGILEGALETSSMAELGTHFIYRKSGTGNPQPKGDPRQCSTQQSEAWLRIVPVRNLHVRFIDPPDLRIAVDLVSDLFRGAVERELSATMRDMAGR